MTSKQRPERGKRSGLGDTKSCQQVHQWLGEQRRQTGQVCRVQAHAAGGGACPEMRDTGALALLRLTGLSDVPGGESGQTQERSLS